MPVRALSSLMLRVSSASASLASQQVGCSNISSHPYYPHYNMFKQKCVLLDSLSFHLLSYSEFPLYPLTRLLSNFMSCVSLFHSPPIFSIYLYSVLVMFLFLCLPIFRSIYIHVCTHHKLYMRGNMHFFS